MGKKGVVVAAGVLAVITVISGAISAVYMALRVYPNPRKHGEFCRYMPSPAMPLGLVAAALSLTTQVLASTAIGCCGAWRNVPSQTRRVVAVLTFVASWILAIKVVILFMVSTLLGMGGYARNIAKNGSCIAPGVGIFMAATILFLVVVSLDVASYILVRTATLDTSKTDVAVKKPVGIAMGESGAAKC
ncbi:uncharacterized protein LOC124655843 [Lolium rigidum]|uniref:uncharacterized protein LOC124655843 n=1 Tax=Lolium rigidum TaxID=89674 RepID=UPI001F5DA87F|nr:uncharacterized protein LOC124655843 [Lolium rigidum]